MERNEEEYASLFLLTNVFICRDEEDLRIWKLCFGKFSSCFYKRTWFPFLHLVIGVCSLGKI